ncbi:MAG: IS200/IS605 family transposase [Anaerolineae bacterium]|jgi:putative transposase|nr:IS200/IS605 family transposase [Anaerolineae bacterium]
MAFWKCYYHLIWATKHRQPIITTQYERVIYASIRQKAYNLKLQVLEINGVADHIHIVMMIHPSYSVADIVQQLKGISSHEINQGFALKENFYWQSGYGALTYGEKVIPQVIEYVANQKQHHEAGNLLPYLEKIDE